MPFGVWQQADEATGGGAITRAFAVVAGFKGGKGKICTLLARQVQDWLACRGQWVSGKPAEPDRCMC